MPAHFSGIAGLKATATRIPLTGHLPPPANIVAHMACVGPVARRVEDISLALWVLSGYDREDPASVPFVAPPPVSVDDLAGQKVALYTGDGVNPVDPEIVAASCASRTPARSLRGSSSRRWRSRARRTGTSTGTASTGGLSVPDTTVHRLGVVGTTLPRPQYVVHWTPGPPRPHTSTPPPPRDPPTHEYRPPSHESEKASRCPSVERAAPAPPPCRDEACRRASRAARGRLASTTPPPHPRPLSRGRRSAHGAACSNAAAARRTSASAWRRPAIWSPIGSPSAEKPHGTVIAGCPVRLNG